MASLIENLVEILNGEDSEYQKLIDLSNKKSEAIVHEDLDLLSKVTTEEQEIVSVITNLESQRSDAMAKIARILNTDVAGLKLDLLISLLNKSPKEQKDLSAVHDKLHNTLHEMKLVNERNEELLKNAIDMVNFNMNLIQSMKKAPETANYGRGAYNTGNTLGTDSGNFDARQ